MEQGKQDSKRYEVLSDAQIDDMHARFHERLKKRANKIIPASCDDRTEQVQSLYEVLLWAERNRKKLKTEELREMVEERKWSPHISAFQKAAEKNPWSLYRRYQINKSFKKREETPLVDELFGDKERIYLKVNYLREYSDTYYDVHNYLSHRGYEITDYVKGYATDKAGKQTYKIGKLLKKREPLLEQYKEDETRSSVDKYIVLSRAKEDIANMSTNRAWGSCMAAKGIFRHKVPAIVGSKTLVAYLITENDPEINNPLSRLLLKPYDSRKTVNEKSAYQEKSFPALSDTFSYWKQCLFDKDEPLTPQSIVYALGNMYGLGSESFKETVQQFTDDHLNNPDNTAYRLHGHIYADGSPTWAVKRKEGVRASWGLHY